MHATARQAVRVITITEPGYHSLCRVTTSSEAKTSSFKGLERIWITRATQAKVVFTDTSSVQPPCMSPASGKITDAMRTFTLTNDLVDPDDECDYDKLCDSDDD
jgi:hypothetical protein